MTAVLPNNQNGATGFQIDGYVYPQFIGYALRAPTTQDIYAAGTRWQDNSVSPPVIYETSGAGIWNTSTSGGAGIFTSLIVTPGPVSLTGTTTINTSGADATTIGTGGTGAVNIGNTTGNTTVTGTLTSSAGITASTGNIVATAGQVNAGTSMNAGTTITATLGNITATNGNLVLAAPGNKLVIADSAPTTDSVGTTDPMITGSVTITSTAIEAASKIIYSRRTLGTAMGNVSITAQAGGSATLTSDAATETSTFDYIIIN